MEADERLCRAHGFDRRADAHDAPAHNQIVLHLFVMPFYTLNFAFSVNIHYICR